MKSFSRLAVFALCLGMASFAHAADFKMNVLDPLTGGVPELSNTFSFNFVPCSSFNNAPAGLAGTDGCFEGINATNLTGQGSPVAGQTWTSLSLTFANTAVLAGKTADCVSLDAPDSIFSVVTSCGVTGNTWIVSFMNGAITPGDSFFIAEDGIDPASFPTVTAVAGTATPEPGSMVLLATGGLAFGLLVYNERKAIPLAVRA